MARKFTKSTLESKYQFFLSSKKNMSPKSKDPNQLRVCGSKAHMRNPLHNIILFQEIEWTYSHKTNTRRKKVKICDQKIHRIRYQKVCDRLMLKSRQNCVVKNVLKLCFHLTRNRKRLEWYETIYIQKKWGLICYILRVLNFLWKQNVHTWLWRLLS